MRFVCNGTAVTGKATVKVVETHPDRQTLESVVQGKGFDLKSRCRYEFDGMMWFDVTLTPRGPLAAKNVKIEIPLRSEVSTLYNCFARDYFHFQGYRAGALTQSVKCNHYKLENGRLPAVWVGNEERGLYYFTQDQAGRRLKNRKETVHLDPGKNGALLIINLIDYPSSLKTPVTWSFGLQVTPARPFVRKRTTFRLGTYYRPGIGLVPWFPWEGVMSVPDARFKYANYEADLQAVTLPARDFRMLHIVKK